MSYDLIYGIAHNHAGGRGHAEVGLAVGTRVEAFPLASDGVVAVMCTEASHTPPCAAAAFVLSHTDPQTHQAALWTLTDSNIFPLGAILPGESNLICSEF